MEILLLITGVASGLIIGWLMAKLSFNSSLNSGKEVAQLKFRELEKEFLTSKATSDAQLQTARENAELKQKEITDLSQRLKEFLEEE